MSSEFSCFGLYAGIFALRLAVLPAVVHFKKLLISKKFREFASLMQQSDPEKIPLEMIFLEKAQGAVGNFDQFIHQIKSFLESDSIFEMTGLRQERRSLLDSIKI